MYLKALTFLLISVSVESSPISYFEGGNANAFIDSILKAVMTKYNNTLDPFHITDKVIGFQQRIGLITFGAQLKLTQGTVTGLSNLRRSGDSTLSSDKTGFKVRIVFGDKNVHLHYKAELALMDLHTHATLESQIGEIGVTTSISLDSSGQPSITEFHIDELDHVKVDIHTPIFILDPIIDLMTEEFIKVFNPMAKELIGTIVTDMVGTELKKFKIPIG